jgi:hypothetical protein
MRTFRLIAAALTLTTIAVVPALAQEPGNVGLTMTSGSVVGITIEANRWLSIRPEVVFSRATIEASGASNDLTTTFWGPGLSLLFHVKSWDATRLYLAPEWSYTRATTSSSDTKSTGHSLFAMVGAQHQITNRFAAFGEAGLGRSTAKSEGQFSSNSSRTWKTRSVVGVILFF